MPPDENPRHADDFPFHHYHPKAGDVVVDIGAGRGEGVPAFSLAVGSEGRVFADDRQPNDRRHRDPRPRVKDYVHRRNRRYPFSGTLDHIQGLWIGPRLSTMERLCISSFQRHGHTFHLYVYGDVEGIPPGTIVHDANRILPESSIFTYRDHPTYAGFANFFRYKLLLEQGGWYVDLDTVCLKPFAFGTEYVFSSQSRDGQVRANLAAMRVPANSGVMQWAWDACKAMDPNKLRWGESGPELITRAVEEHGLSRYVHSPETFCPVPYPDWKRVLQPGSPWQTGFEPHAVHLWNEMWRRASQDKDWNYDSSSLYQRLKRRYLPYEPSNAPARNAVVVLGMHRSGLSLCMNVLSKLGISVEEESTRREFVEIHDSILASLGLTWHSLWPATLNDNWIDDPQIAPAKQRLVTMIRDRTWRRGCVWGFSDPRLCLLLPLYEQIFALCGVEPSFVVCIRNPASVARSLERKNQFPHLLSELIWMDHTARAIRGAGKRLKAIIHFEDWFCSLAQQASLLAEGLKLARVDQPAAVLLDGIVDHSLRDRGSDRNDNKGRLEVNGVESIYRLLRGRHYEAALMKTVEFQRTLRLASVPSPNTCQLFWKTETLNVFTEACSCRMATDILPSRRIVQLLIPVGLRKVTGLRVDPASLPGLAHLFAMRLLKANGTPLWEWDGRPESISGWESYNLTLLPDLKTRGVIVHFSNSDPGFVLPVSTELKEISENGGVFELEFAWLRSAN